MGIYLPDTDIIVPTIVDNVIERAKELPTKELFRFYKEDSSEYESISYRELDIRARAIAYQLSNKNNLRPGDRAILIYAPGRDLTEAFFGCLYAGVIAVLAYPPANIQLAEKLQSIIIDAEPHILLTDTEIHSKLKKLNLLHKLTKIPLLKSIVTKTKLNKIEELHLKHGDIPISTTDDIDNKNSNNWQYPAINEDSISHIQYTSGSTGYPKGVVITHKNLLHNLQNMEVSGKFKPTETIGVFWAPPQHDMGLLGGILFPLFLGETNYLFSPLAFLKNPANWLRAIPDNVKVLIAIPNFAFEYSAKKVTEAEKKDIHLGTCYVVLNGAEPVHEESMNKFYEAFKECGFPREAFYPSYGLAESVAIVSGGDPKKLYNKLYLEKNALKQHEIVLSNRPSNNTQTLVSCGKPCEEVQIVNPETQEICPADTIGELWLHGPSVAQGYWNKPEDTAKTFHAKIKNNPDKNKLYLRTGDLGFLHEGELYLTGRNKDLIIIRGYNYYPQDIEYAVSRSHPNVLIGRAAAMSETRDAEEQLIVLCEVKEDSSAQYVEIVDAISKTVGEECGIIPSKIVLLAPKTILKTTSGKIRRKPSYDALLAGKLSVVYSWENEKNNDVEGPLTTEKNVAKSDMNSKKIEGWIIDWISSHTSLSTHKINPDQTFTASGLDSVLIVELFADLSESLSQPIDPTVAWEYPTIAQLAEYLSETNTKQYNVEEDQSQIAIKNEPIAIIGYSCRFPGKVVDPESYYNLLESGKDAIQEVPFNRFNINEFYSPQPKPGKMYTRWGGFIENVDQFDALFFKISPAEAQVMDPQQRLLLEVSWEALENAHYPPTNLQETNTGIFIGISSNDYGFELIKNTSPEKITAYFGTGNSYSVAAGRLAYFFGTHGPCLAIDTACSSSLVTIYQACEALHNGTCDLALAGGVNVMLTPEVTINFCQASMMAKDGRCKTFDASADGYVRSEGCGIVILKRLSQALEDKDNILAVIKGGAINQDGSSNGLTAPNETAQEAVMKKALQSANLEPKDITFLETHGTGTKLGDPIEIKAINAIYCDSRAPDNTLHLGALKSQIGHLEAAAGIAGIIKIILSLQNKQLFKNLHLTNLNPLIHKNPCLDFLIEARQWKTPPGTTRKAAISSFGFSGTNAHLILEEAPIYPPTEKIDLPSYLFTFSAKTKEALKDNLVAFGNWLEKQADSLLLYQVAYLSTVRRSHFPERCAIIAANIAELKQGLERTGNYKEGTVIKDFLESEEGNVLQNSLNTLLDKINDVKNNTSEFSKALDDIASAYVKGLTIDWEKIYPTNTPLDLRAPNYQFQNESYWFKEFAADLQKESDEGVADNFFDKHSSDNGILRFEKQFTGEEFYLKHHKIHGRMTLPAAAYIAMALEAAKFNKPENKNIILKNVILAKPIIVNNDKPYVQITLQDNDGFTRFELKRITSENVAELNAKGSIYYQSQTEPPMAFVEEIKSKLEQSIDIQDYYQKLKQNGYEYGKYFQVVRKLYADDYTAFAELALPEEVASSKTEFLLHPNLLDGALQITASLIKLDEMNFYLPFNFSEVVVEKSLPSICYVVAKKLESSHSMHHFDINLIATDGTLLTVIKDFAIKVVPKSSILIANEKKEPTKNFAVVLNYQKGLFDSFAYTLNDANPVTVENGDTCEFINDFKYVINNNEASDYQQLFAELYIRNLLAENIYFLLTTKEARSIENQLRLISSALSEYKKTFIINIIYPDNDLNTNNEVSQIINDAQKLNSNISFKIITKNMDESVKSNQIDSKDSLLSNAKDNTINEMENALIEIISPILKIDRARLSPLQDLSEYGTDSLALVEFASQLMQKYGVELSPAIMFEHRNLHSLATYLIATYPEIISKTNNKQETQSIVETKVAESLPQQHLKIQPVGTQLNPPPKTTDIAIIGMDGIFPGSSNLEAFWQNLLSQRDLITEIPPDRWNWQEYYGTASDQTIVKWGGFIENIDCFDGDFFKILPIESESMDPQQRILLQSVWHAIENSGNSLEELQRKKTGVFIGVSTNDYAEITIENTKHSPLAPTGLSHAIVANRISYILDLTGPSEAIDTACSSSLVALHHAVTAMRNDECHMAIVSGVNALLTPTLFVEFSKAGMLSPDGHCKTFDKSADGYVRGEGVGSILLKPLAQALKDRDHIYAVIKGTAINHGGHVNSLTTPNPNAQAEVITKAISEAEVPVETISYIEAHGTGTPLGDPVEINGLKKAFQAIAINQGNENLPKAYCGITALKTNVGHLEAAAGVAGIIKTALAIDKGIIPGIANFKELNPYIEIDQTPFFIATKTINWPELIDDKDQQIPRRAGVSSFGFGGSNAHVVLEQAPQSEAESPDKKSAYLFTISAKTTTALENRIKDLYQWLIANKDNVKLKNLSFTLNSGRTHFDKRCAIVADSIAQLEQSLEQISQKKLPSNACLSGEKLDANYQQAIFKELLTKLNQEVGNYQKLSAVEYRSKLEALAKFYCEGYLIDWQALLADEKAHRIVLPTYPFAKDRYWVTKREISPEDNIQKETLEPGISKNVYFYEPILVEENIQDSPTISDQDHFLIFDEKEDLFSLIKNSNRQINLLKISSDSNQNNNSSEDIINVEDYERMVEIIKKEGVNKIIINIPGDKHLDAEEFAIKKAINGTYLILLYFAQTMIKNKIFQPIDVLICFPPDQAFGGSFYHALLGLVKTLSLELPSLKCRLIESKDVNEIIKEFNQNAVYVLHKDGKRYIREYKEVIDLQNLITAKKLKTEGAYIITGGAGGIGLILAQHLIHNYHAPIALIGRSNVSDKVVNLAAQSKDVQIKYYAADLSDKNQCENVISQISNDFGIINGIIHCAGVLNDGPLITKTAQDSQIVFKPKIDSIINLDKATKNIKLDFFILFSSIAAIFGNFGQADYAYANAFMDSFSKWRNIQAESKKRSGHTLSMNWPYWTSGGMHANKEILDLIFASTGVTTLSTQDGLAIVVNALEYKQPELIIIPGDKIKITQYIKNSAFLGKKDKSSNQTVVKQVDSTFERTKSVLIDVMSKELKIEKDKIVASKSIFELGIDSISFLMLIDRLNKQFKIDISSSMLLQINSIDDFISYLIKNHRSEIEGYLENNSENKAA